jgi:hypothetical protein
MVSKFNIWLSHPDRREFKGVTFAKPGEENEGMLNLFTGFTVQPQSGDWSLFKQLIMECLANNDQDIYDYIIAWMADAVQNITNKPGVVLALRGEQGTGKSFFAENFGHLFGHYYFELAQKEHLLGKFNHHFMNKLLVFIDEAIWGGEKERAGVIKNYITSKKINIEKKGHDIITVDNFMRFIIASNSSWMVPAGEGERRYCVLNVSDRHKEDNEFFRSVEAQLKNGGYEAMMHDLLNHDLSNIDIKKFSKTAALLDQIYRNLDAFNQFWYTILDKQSYEKTFIAESITEHGERVVNQVFLVHSKFNDSNKLFITKQIVKQFYDLFCKEQSIRYRQIDFASDLKKVLHKDKINKSWRIESGAAPVNVYPLPPFKEARELFEKYVLGFSVPHWHHYMIYSDLDDFVEQLNAENAQDSSNEADENYDEDATVL